MSEFDFPGLVAPTAGEDVQKGSAGNSRALFSLSQMRTLAPLLPYFLFIAVFLGIPTFILLWHYLEETPCSPVGQSLVWWTLSTKKSSSLRCGSVFDLESSLHYFSSFSCFPPCCGCICAYRDGDSSSRLSRYFHMLFLQLLSLSGCRARCDHNGARCHQYPSDCRCAAQRLASSTLCTELARTDLDWFGNCDHAHLPRTRWQTERDCSACAAIKCVAHRLRLLDVA